MSNHNIVFGFGDELDENYAKIENLDDNKYLINLKSFAYLQNSNYSHLLNQIEETEYEVYVLGHSLGLSDRTLLNTIFEHENCYKVHLFYHQIDKLKDNFTELIFNISRHFKEKALMRKRIVDKTKSIAIPQDKAEKKIHYEVY
jgi:hypothetical protein